MRAISTRDLSKRDVEFSGLAIRSKKTQHASVRNRSLQSVEAYAGCHSTHSNRVELRQDLGPIHSRVQQRPSRSESHGRNRNDDQRELAVARYFAHVISRNSCACVRCECVGITRTLMP
jgi:hypothetical protein